MSFLDPMFLWMGLLGLPLIAVYLLKVRPRRAPATALFLWDQVLVEKKSSALFRRLRDLFSLVLMLLTLGLIVFGAARPRLEHADERDLLVILDNSASMSARQADGSTFLDLARRQARDLLASVSGTRRGSLASLSSELRMECLLTDDRNALQDAVAGVPSSALPTRWSALRAIEGLAESGDTLRVVLLSDGSDADFEVPDGIDWIPVVGARQVQNAGFVAADLRVVPGRDELLLFFQVAATRGLVGRRAEVLCLQDGNPLKITPVTLEDGTSTGVLQRLQGTAGRYQLRLQLVDGEVDGIVGDNVVDLVAHQPQPLRVSVAAEARYFFENAVHAFDQSEGMLRLASEAADLALVRGASAPEGSPGLGAIVFAPQAGSRWAAEVGEYLAQPVPRLLTAQHPAFAFIAVDALRFEGARQVTPPTGAAVLIENEVGQPLAWQIRNEEGPPGLVLNMEPERGDFFLSPYFPLLIRGAAAYLGGRVEQAQAVYPTGASIPVPGVRPEDEVLVRRPLDQEESPTRLSGAQTLNMLQPGYYEVAGSRAAPTLAAASLHRGETCLVAREAPALPDDLTYGAPLWVRLLVFGLLILVAEEVLYHRRKVG